jgi:hypothetical protein
MIEKVLRELAGFAGGRHPEGGRQNAESAKEKRAGVKKGEYEKENSKRSN